MKLLMISGDRSLTAGKRGAFWYTLEELHKQFDRIDILCPRAQTEEVSPSPFPNVHLHPSPRGLWYQPWWILRRGRALIASHEHDVMTVHEYPPFYNGIGARWLSRRTGVPYALEIHHIVGYPIASSLTEWVGRVLSWLFLRWDARRATRVRTVNQTVRSRLVQWGIPSEKIEVVSSLYLDPTLKPDWFAPKSFDFALCGRLVKNKGFSQVLDAMRAVPGARLLIVGDGPERARLEGDARRLGVADRVVFAGWLPTQLDVIQAIRMARVFVMNSRSEGGPRVALEAMACGIPVISTPVGVMPSVIRTGQNGLLVPFRIPALIQAMQLLHADTALRGRLAHAAAEDVLGRYDRVQSIRAYAAFLSSLPAERRPLRLLIMAQRVDQNDPVLGAFHGWIRTFGTLCAEVTAIGQAVGSYDLPANVRVFSLGKEQGRSKVLQIARFYALLWRERKHYDAFFVHMSPVWVVLGSPLLLLLRKRRYLWYEVKRRGVWLKPAVFCSRKAFSATEHGLTFFSQKNVITGQGADTDVFVPDGSPRDARLLCTVGRLTPIKHVDAILRGFASLPSSCRIVLVGGTVTPVDEEYVRSLETYIHEQHLDTRVERCILKHAELPALLRRAQLFLHACGGGLDKSVLEAMACECLVVSCSDVLQPFLPPACQATLDTLGQKAAALLALSDDEKCALGRELRRIAVAHHSMRSVVGRLVREMSVAVGPTRVRS